MKPIFQTCTPRDEVLHGDLREQQFAASLTQVLRGTGDAVYSDPATYFATTYPTSKLQDLLREALGRLTGADPAASSVIRLETSFGGGKTHNLIALYHLARGGLAPDEAARFVKPELVPTSRIDHVAGVVGPDMAVAEGIDHGDIRTHTLWGELAYQLGLHAGGPEGARQAYELVSKSDQQRTDPGTQAWEKIIGDRPALLMIDEIAHYLRVASGADYKAGRTSLAGQTVAFLMSLMKFAAESKRTVLVYTLAESGDAFGKESDELREELAEAHSVSARSEHVITPSAEDEISAIVTHRLFANVDRPAARATAEAFAACWSRLNEQGVDLPSRAFRAEYREELVQDYPFHPELLTTLNRKTSTIPNFQRTRGVLRLLAQAVRDLWQRQPADCHLICPHHLDLGDDHIANDLTSRLDRPQFKQVIEADIASPKKGTRSHAQELDTDWVDAGKPGYAGRCATTVFLHSLVQTGQSGVDPTDLRLAVLQPGDDPALLDKALQRLTDRCWFFDYDGLRYRFKTEPSLRKIVDDEMGLVGKTQAKAELDERVQKIWRKGIFLPRYFPAEASEVDDDAQNPKLVILHYDAARIRAAAADAPPDLAVKLFEHKGSMQEYRVYKNNLVFLIADEDQVDPMIAVAQRYLATRRIVGDGERMQEFSKAQAGKLKDMADRAEVDLRVAVTRAYRHLYYPSADAPRKHSHLAHQTLQPEDQGKTQQDQTEVVLKVLKNLDKVLTADDKPLNAQYVKARAWPHQAVSITTEDLRREFCKRLGLKMLLDINQLKRTIKEGAQRGVWVYYPAGEGIGYAEASPAPLIEISEDATLYTPDEARRIGIRIKGEGPTDDEAQACPVCNQRPCQCDADEAEGDDRAGGGRPHVPITADGPPAQAFQKVLDQCQDRQVRNLASLTLRIDGMGREAARDIQSLGLAIPQIGKARVSLDQRLVLEFDGDEKLNIEFAGSWDRYKRIKSITDAMTREAANASVRASARLEFPDGLDVEGDQFQTMRDVLANLDMGKLTVDATPSRPPAAGHGGEDVPADTTANPPPSRDPSHD